MTPTGGRRVTRYSTAYVVLVRGINVGRGRKLPMADLRQICPTRSHGRPGRD